MKNVRKSKFNLDNVSEFDVSGYKQLLLSTSTQEELVNKELPLVNTGVILEDRPVISPTETVTNIPLVDENSINPAINPIISPVDVKEPIVSPTPEINIPKEELPLVSKESIRMSIPTITPVEITPETPLVKGNPNNVFIKAGSVLNGFNVTEPTPEINIPKEELPLVSKESIRMSIPTITPVEITPETPLVKGNPNNVFIKAGSVLNGFNVTEPTPFVAEPTRPLTPVDDPSIETVINEEVNEPQAFENEVTNTENFNLETPQDFNSRIEEPVSAPTPVDPYISANEEIETIRSEFNEKIDKIMDGMQKLKESTNLSLDSLSRAVEKARQLSQNDSKAIMDSVQKGIGSLDESMYPETRMSR